MNRVHAAVGSQSHWDRPFCSWQPGVVHRPLRAGSGGQGPAGVVADLGAAVFAGAAGDRDQRDGLAGRGGRGPVPGGAGPARPGGGWRPGRQPCAAAVPSGLRAVRHQRVRGWRAAAAARSRASSPSTGPNSSASPEASDRPRHVARGMVRVTSAAMLGPAPAPGAGAGAGTDEWRRAGKAAEAQARRVTLWLRPRCWRGGRKGRQENRAIWRILFIASRAATL